MECIKGILNLKLRIKDLTKWTISVFLICCIFFPCKAVAEEGSQKIRKPVYAGSFYPADRNTLEKQIDGYLKEVDSKVGRTTAPLIGFISPHAGYIYSGQVAAYAYSRLKGRAYKTVIIIGSSHRMRFEGIAIQPSGIWETPLGNVEIDQEMAKKLMEQCKAVKAFSQAFEQEHSLEVQLPFLQRTLGTFKIVPVIFGSMDVNELRTFSEALTKILKQKPEDTLIIASSDMSHYHTYDQANKMDKSALKTIESLNADKLNNGFNNGEYELCGAQGVIALMTASKILNAEAKTLHYANSGDVSGDKGRVVGYGAIAFYLADAGHGLNKKEQKMLLAIARKTINDSITKGEIPGFQISKGRLLERRGAFVTLTKEGQLRGCVGYILPVTPLYKAVSEMAVAASSRDSRFQAVTKDELKDIHIEISVLSHLKLIDNTDDVEVGKHGLYITRGKNTGLLLPQVATEQKWNREEFLRQTCRKSGLPVDAWKEKGTNVYTFTAQIFSE